MAARPAGEIHHMFEAHFGLRENPFSTSHDPRFVYPSPEHLEAVAHFRYGMQNSEAFVLVTGEVGTGKTTAIHDLVSRLPQHAQVALIQNTALSRPELVEEICRRFGVEVSAGLSKPSLLARLEQTLRGRSERGQVCLLVVDEAQNLTPEMLEEIRLLSNFELGGGNHFLICLVGQPELEERLGQAELRQLRQRIGVKYRLKPLDPLECGRYLHHRLRVAGGDGEYLFPGDTARLLHLVTNGIPREINIVAGQAMLNAYVDGSPSVRPEHVQQVVDDFAFRSVLPDRPVEEPRDARRPAASATPGVPAPPAVPAPPRVSERPRVAEPTRASDTSRGAEAPRVAGPPLRVAPRPAAESGPAAPLPAPSFAPAPPPSRHPAPEPPSPVPMQMSPPEPIPAAPSPAPTFLAPAASPPPVPPPALPTPPPARPPAPLPPVAARGADEERQSTRGDAPRFRIPRGLIAAALGVVFLGAAFWTGAAQNLWQAAFPPAEETPEFETEPEESEPAPVAATPAPAPLSSPAASQAARGWSVQIASYRSQEQAREVLSLMERRTGVSGRVTAGSGVAAGWYGVRLGSFASHDEALRRAEEWTEREWAPLDRFVVAPGS